MTDHDVSDELEEIFDSDRYRAVLGRYPTGVVIVTAMDRDEAVAMVIGSFVSVSIDPPLVGFLPAKASSSWPRMEGSGAFTVNVLGDDQVDVCNAFFRKEEDPFAVHDWVPGSTGAPRLAGCLAHIDCTIHEIVDAGDHWFVLGAVEDLDHSEDGGPLVFLGGGYGRHEAF